MSDKEKEIFKKDIEIALVKKWWPLVLFICGVVTFAINGTHWFDNNIARKSDTDKIMIKVDDLAKQIANMEKIYVSSDQALSAHRGIHKRIDSLGRVVSLQRRGALTARRRPDGTIEWRDYAN